MSQGQKLPPHHRTLFGPLVAEAIGFPIATAIVFAVMGCTDNASERDGAPDAGTDAGDPAQVTTTQEGGSGGSSPVTANAVPDASMDSGGGAGGTSGAGAAGGAGGTSSAGASGSAALGDAGVTATSSGGTANATQMPACTGGSPLSMSPDQVAARLARLLWAAPADAQLVAQAETLRIADANAAACFASAMLDDPRTETGLWTFVRAWLGVDDLTTLDKNREVFPLFSGELTRDFRDELRTFILDNFHTNASLLSLFDGSHVFVNERLAALYGIDGVTGEAFQKQLAPSGRGGMLTQGWFLALGATPSESSPARRGARIWDKLLCGPPLDIDHASFDIEEVTDESLTTRERQEQLIAANPTTCASCHQYIDPIGYTFEHFDGLGQHRLDENGKAIDSTATGRFPSNQVWQAVSPIGFAAQALASTQVAGCLASKWLTYALGRAPGNQQDSLSQAFIQSNLTGLRQGLLAVAVSPSYLGYSGALPTALPELISVNTQQR